MPFVDDATSPRPVAPCVGQVFDTMEEAQKVYNKYAKKLGFGTRMCYTKRTQKKGCDHIIRRVFECVHARGGKGQVGGEEGGCDPEWYDATEEDGSASNKEPDFGNKKVGPKRCRNKVDRHECRPWMAVLLRNGKWEVSVLEEQHPHPQ
mgnify:CR=1 FL=1